MTEFIIPAELTVVVPDRTIRQWYNGRHMHGSWHIRLPALGTGWYMGITISTNPITALEDVFLLQPWGAPLDRWNYIPGCSTPILLPIKAIEQGPAHEEFNIRWNTPKDTPEFDIKIGALFVESLDMRLGYGREY